MSDPAAIASILVSGIGSGAVAAALFFSSREVKVLREQLALDAGQAERGLVAQRAANDLAELIVDLADSVTSMIRHGQLDEADRDAWAAALASYGSSPAVRMIVREYEGQGIWRDATFDSLHPLPSQP